MLLDTFNPSTSGSPNSAAQVRRLKYKARRFEFSLPVVKKIAEMLRDNPADILHNIQFALPPYDCCYLEFDAACLFNITDNFNHAPASYGFLIENNCAWMLSTTGTKGDKGDVAPFCYTISPDVNPPEGFSQLKLFEYDHDVVNWQAHLGHFLGSTLGNSTLSPDVLAILCAKVHVWIDDNVGHMLSEARRGGDEEMVQAGEKMISETSGDLRNLLALLLWINQPKLINQVYVPATRRMVKNKPVSFAEHHILKINPTITARQINTTFSRLNGYKVRRHEVGSFWRTHNRNDACEHVWPMEPNIRGHYHCSKCEQFRVRVKQHERGSAEVGYVTKDYSV